MTAISLPITGMTCASCATRVEQALMGVPGVTQVRVNLAADSAWTTQSSLAPPAPH